MKRLQQKCDLLNTATNEAAPLVAVFDGWGLVPMVSGDLPHVKFSFLRLVHQNGAALPKLVMAEAAPHPLFRFEHESTLHRILMHVPKLLRTLVFGEYHEIVEAALPNMALF